MRVDPPTGLHHLLLQHAQHLGLRLQAHVADLVEEDRAAVRQLELAAAVGHGAGERAAHVAEQLALDQLLGNRRAVHLDERRRCGGGSARGCCAPPAPCRCRSRRRSARGRWSAPPSPPARAAAPSPQLSPTIVCCASTLARSARFSASSRRCRSALRTTSTVFSSDSGFSTKSNAPILIARTADSTLPWPGDDHDLRVDLPLAHPRQRRQAVHPRQPDVEHDDVVRRAAPGARGTPRRCRRRRRRSPRRAARRRARCARQARRRRSGSMALPARSAEFTLPSSSLLGSCSRFASQRFPDIERLRTRTDARLERP